MYGWIGSDAGSLSSANWLILRELLRRGISVDFYANSRHVGHPQIKAQHLNYIGLDPPRVLAALPPALQHPINRIGRSILREVWRRRYAVAVSARLNSRPYDALLSLGTPPAFAIDTVPTICWLQDAPGAELASIRRLRPLITRISGRAFYLALELHYWASGRRWYANSEACDKVIVGSSWSLSQVIPGGRLGNRLHSLPYPVDLTYFSPSSSQFDKHQNPVILCLGRQDPRKRLDLLLVAFEEVVSRYPGARLRIVGQPGYAPHWFSLVDASPIREQVELCPPVPRSRVPALLREATVLVQTSENENFGTAVAEALACGIPVVVGPSNGTAEYIDSESRVFASYDPSSVASAIISVIEAQATRPQDVRTSTRTAAEEWLTTSNIVDRLLAITQTAIDERSRLEFGSTASRLQCPDVAHPSFFRSTKRIVFRARCRTNGLLGRWSPTGKP